MLTQAEIAEALQFSRFFNSNPLNTTGAERYVITYQYSGASAPGDFPGAGSYSGWRAFNDAERAAFERALAHIETFLNVDFVETTGQADPDLNVGAAAVPGSAIGYGGYSVRYSGSEILTWDGMVLFDSALDLTTERAANLFLHELGHAMGLRHTFDEAADLPPQYDSNLYSVMSYRANPITGTLPDEMMLFDVLALQDIWGAAAHNAGNTRYGAPGTGPVDLIWDSGGSDTLDAASAAGRVHLDLRQGQFSSIEARMDTIIAHGTNIEHAIGGGGRDRLIGNALDNRLEGGGRADRISGRGGEDTLLGGSGADSLMGGGGHDRLAGGTGQDLLAGGNGRDVLLGRRGSDSLEGGNGNDLLHGHRGSDTLDGGAGNDRLAGMAGADVFVFRGSAGHDTVGDFQEGADILQITGHGSREDVLAQARETGDGVLFDFAADTSLLVRNTTILELSDDILT
ncbi:M10 family metallopeptidase C-terminal domain-containing protein [Roseobacteraceae bacterium NS-SX3]